MSRHRNIRNYAYEEDMYEDVYGHSVEEHDLCVSPTTAQQFMYQRGESRHPNLSSFLEESLGYDEEDTGGKEEVGEHLEIPRDYKTPKLDQESEAKLRSCLDEFHSILGINCDEEQAKIAILKHNFDLERALDDVLSKGGAQDLKSRPTSGKEKDVLKIETSFSKPKNLWPTSSGSEALGPGTNVQSRFIDSALRNKSPSVIGSSGMGQSPSNFEGSRRHGLSLLRSPSDNDVLKSGRLGEVSQENKSSNISLVNCISARDNLRTSEDLVGMAKLSSLATKEPSKLVSLRELSQKSEGSGSSLLSQLSAKASSGIHGDQTGFSALEKLGSLRELSQANKSYGKSMLSLLSAKGQRGIAEDQGGLCSVSDLSCREPGNLGSLGELCEKKDNSGFSLLRQSRGSTAESSSSKCLSDKKNKNIVSLRELSQMGDDTGKSPLSQLLKTRSLETPKDLKGLSSLAGLPRNAPENRVSSKKATQNKLSFGNTATDELTANERNVNTETPSLKTLLSRPPDSNNTSSSLYTSSLPLQSGLSGSNSSKSDYFMPSLRSLLNPPEENKFSSRHKLADTSPKVESGAVVNLGEVTLTSLSGRFTNDGPETKVNGAKNGTKSKQTTSSLDLFMSSSLSSITGGDSRERASGVLQLSSLSGVGSSESRKGLKISSEEHTNSAAVLSFYGTPKTGISLAQRTTTLGNQLEYGVTQLVPDVQRPAGKVDLSVSLKRVRPKQETKNTSELTHSRGLNSTTSLEKSIGNLNLNNSESDLDEVDGGLRDSSVDVEDGFHMLATGVEECCISGRAAAELIASPTMFARTLLVKYRKPKDVRVPAVRGGFFDCSRELLDIVPFDFSTPSPDDLVKSKQKGVLGRK